MTDNIELFNKWCERNQGMIYDNITLGDRITVCELMVTRLPWIKQVLVDTDNSKSIVELLETVMKYGMYKICYNPEQANRLTKREKQVYEGVKLGKTSQQIADELCISRRTVEHHRANMKQRLNQWAGRQEPQMPKPGFTIKPEA